MANNSVRERGEGEIAAREFPFGYGHACGRIAARRDIATAPLTIEKSRTSSERNERQLEKQNGRFAGVRALVFDLDGTLIDSKLDLALSIDATLKHMGRASLPHETIYGYVGNGAAVLVRRALGDSVTDAEADEGHRFFLVLLPRTHAR